ncbi:hypothetical protein K5549_011840 [Capra hircus]|uniref:Uncharacterized protein n=1 Tax=Capra hircus TaxID=9925 RepID=A0A452EFU8_CAPHI|nr:hypothetical protein K5549_011840 [Capra hircus]
MQKSCEENKGKPQNMPQAEEDLPLEAIPQEAERNPQPSEGGVSQEAEGNLRGGLTQPDPEEMIRGTDELERLREEIRRTRSKFVMMHWKQGHHAAVLIPCALGLGFFLYPILKSGPCFLLAFPDVSLTFALFLIIWWSFVLGSFPCYQHLHFVF